jgi:hypothetical protein
MKDSASPRRRAVIVFSPMKRDSIALLRAELEALGLEVLEVPLDDVADTASWAAAAPRTTEQFRILLRPDHLEVWIFDRVTGKVTSREVFAQSNGTPLDARTAVLHAVELLRWKLREAEPTTRREPVPKVRPRAPLPEVDSVDRRQAWLFSVLPQVLYSPGGTGAGVGAEIDIAWRWRQLAARLFAASVLFPNELVSREGSVRVTSRFLGLQGVVMSSERPNLSGVDASLGLGLGLLSTDLRASATSGYRAHDDQLLTIAPMLELRASYLVTNAVAIAVSSSLMLPLRSNSLRFADREAGRYGQFIAAFGVGPQIAVF